MGEMKPWQLIVIVAAVLVLLYTGWTFATADRIDQIDGTMAVDITTGQLYDVRKGRAKGMVAPLKHPETGERVLYPAEETESGQWVVMDRYASGIDEDLKDKSILEGDNARFTPLESSPIRYILK